MQSSGSLAGRRPLYDGARSLPALVIRKYSTLLTGLGSTNLAPLILRNSRSSMGGSLRCNNLVPRHGKGLGRALQERLNLRLQRAPIEARVLLQTLDGLLIKTPHEDRAHPVLLHTHSLNTGASLRSPERWLPFGCHSRADRRRASGLADTGGPSECLAMPLNAPVPWPIRAVTRAQSGSCHTLANTQDSSAQTRSRWWLERDSTPCSALSDCLPSQAICHGLRSRSIAFRIVRSLRMAAMTATLPGRPAATRR
jgi:hypothetical protein